MEIQNGICENFEKRDTAAEKLKRRGGGEKSRAKDDEIGAGYSPVVKELTAKSSAAATPALGRADTRSHNSSLSLKTAYPSGSRSVSSMGEYTASSIKKWWDWGWSWLLSRKPTFAQYLEMNEEESKLLGFHSKGSLKHVFFKLRSEVRKLAGSSQNVGLPQTCKYNSFDYAKNFDNGTTTRLVY